MMPLVSFSPPWALLKWQVRDFQTEHGLPFAELPSRAVMVQKGKDSGKLGTHLPSMRSPLVSRLMLDNTF